MRRETLGSHRKAIADATGYLVETIIVGGTACASAHGLSSRQFGAVINQHTAVCSGISVHAFNPRGGRVIYGLPKKDWPKHYLQWTVTYSAAVNVKRYSSLVRDQHQAAARQSPRPGNKPRGRPVPPKNSSAPSIHAAIRTYS